MMRQWKITYMKHWMCIIPMNEWNVFKIVYCYCCCFICQRFFRFRTCFVLKIQIKFNRIALNRPGTRFSDTKTVFFSSFFSNIDRLDRINGWLLSACNDNLNVRFFLPSSHAWRSFLLWIWSVSMQCSFLTIRGTTSCDLDVDHRVYTLTRNEEKKNKINIYDRMWKKKQRWRAREK